MTDNNVQQNPGFENLTDSVDVGTYDILESSIDKAHSLIEVATTDEFTDCSKSGIQNYLWTLGEFLEQAKTAAREICQKCLGRSRAQRNK